MEAKKMRYTTRYTAGFCQDLRPCGCCFPQMPMCCPPKQQQCSDHNDILLYMIFGYLIGQNCRN